jgi:hypothetical protein
MHPISLVIDSFMPRAEIGDPLGAGFDRVRRRFIEPLHGARPELRTWFEIQPGSPDQTAWQRLGALVGDSRTTYCSVEVRGDSRSAGYFHFGVRLSHELVTDVPHTITMHAHPTLFGTVPGYDLTAEVEQLAKALAVSTRASTGYVACHLGLARDAEELRGGDVSSTLERDLRAQLRGCYWGNLLSEGHLEALGGRAHVLASCPGEVMEDLSRDGHELVYAGLRGAPCDEQGFALLALERFFAPLLERPTDGDEGSEAPLVFDRSLD